MFEPPLRQISDLSTTNWLRTDLPDLIWPALVVAGAGDNGLKHLYVFQEAMFVALGADFWERSEGALDGRLSSLERIAPSDREQVVAAARIVDTAGVRTAAGAVLSLYDAAPGAWFFSAPDVSLGMEAESLAGELADAVFLAATDRHAAACSRSVILKWWGETGKLQFAPGAADSITALSGYPDRLETQGHADAVIGSIVRGLLSMEENTEGLKWAAQFWRTNGSELACLNAKGEPVPASDSEAVVAPLGAGLDLRAAWGHASLVETKLDDLLVRASRIGYDVLDPARGEVILGLAASAARTAQDFVAAPTLWRDEAMGAAASSLVETEISLAWMRIQPPEDRIFERYQEYGYGKRKLNFELLRESVDRTSDDRRRALVEQERVKLGALEGALQVVDIGSTFSGVNLRQMAEECGLLDRYREIFQRERGSLHKEWWAIEDHAIEPCQNPLHLWHSIPRSLSDRDIRQDAVREVCVLALDVLDLAIAMIEESEPERT